MRKLLGYDSLKFKLAFSCSKLTIETLEQGMKYVQSQQQRYKNDAIAFGLNTKGYSVSLPIQSECGGVVLEFLLLTLNIFHTFF